MSKVQKTETCWIWTGAQNSRGYGQFWNGVKTIQAHWFLLPEQPPKGKEACHHCDNPLCVRPSHIFIGTRSENMIDCCKKGRHRHGDTKLAAQKRKTWHRGSNNHASKLTEEQAKIAKNCPIKYGEASKLAKLFGVSLTVITEIRSGKRWSHLK